MRYALVLLWMLVWSGTSALAQVSVGVAMPGVSIGINVPVYPELVRVPGYPVYYAPRLGSNYFFYDGMYWVYEGDNWYASSWYNGPWSVVGPEAVPLFVLRIPVRYYRDPPMYFRGWRSDAPPRWGQHWGHSWEQRRSGWDRWNRGSVPAAAPLPLFQRQYSGDRYPRGEQLHSLQSQHYRYQPRDSAVRQHFQAQAGQRGTAASQPGQQGALQGRSPRQADAQRSNPAAPVQQGGATGRRSAERGGETGPRVAPAQGAAPQGGTGFQGQQPRQGSAQVQRQPQPAPGAAQVQRQPQQAPGAVQGSRQPPQPQPGAVQGPRQQAPQGMAQQPAPRSAPQARAAPPAPAQAKGQAHPGKGEERK